VTADLVTRLRRLGQTVATAESLTAGMVAAELTSVPGSSAVLRGGLIVYATELKAQLAGVDRQLLADHGPVHPDVAAQLARGARERCGATWGLGLTGVAGPDPQDGIAPGTVYVAVAGPPGVEVRRLRLSGDRQHVRTGSVVAVLELLRECLK
jgi:nicotinamide-nucleotide amidase